MRRLITVSFIVILFTSFLMAQAPWSDQLRSKSARPPTDYNPVPKKLGHYNAEAWATVIDTTWGEGLPTESKLVLFVAAWNFLDDNYAAFQNLDVDWQSVYDLYYNEINAGVSRGRFAAIMNYMAIALMECNTWIRDSYVNYSPLEPGVPLFFVGGNMDNTS